MKRYENIPDELSKLRQWVCTHSDSKVPMKASEQSPASSTNMETWSDFSTAVKAVENKDYEYIGFVFNDNGIVGIDIDDGYDEDGFLSPLAADLIGRCGSYTERSKSGRGFHIFLKGSLPFKGKNNLAGVEIYKQARYFIVTGETMLYDTIIENQDAIDYIVETYFPDEREGQGQQTNRYRVYNPIWEKPIEGKIRLRPVYPRIPNGCRNICLTSLAGMLHNQGYSKEQIYDELLYCNMVACDPSLPKSEVQTITNSVTRYKR